jgi:hypothetical protein
LKELIPSLTDDDINLF